MITDEFGAALQEAYEMGALFPPSAAELEEWPKRKAALIAEHFPEKTTDKSVTYVTVQIGVEVSFRYYGGDYEKYEKPVLAALRAIPGVVEADWNA